MPAAAVIPAPIAYIKVVAVKKLVVEFLAWGPVRRFCGAYLVLCGRALLCARAVTPASCLRRVVLCALIGVRAALSGASITVNKLECLRRALRLEYISME